MPLSTEQIPAAIAPENADPWIALIELRHAAMNGGEPVRLARNPTEPITSNGLVYAKSFFEIELPPDDEVPGPARIAIDNVDGEIGRALEELTGAIECKIMTVLASTPDTYGREIKKLKLRNVRWDMLTASGELTQATIMNNHWPKHQVTPRFFRHLFA